MIARNAPLPRLLPLSALLFLALFASATPANAESGWQNFTSHILDTAAQQQSLLMAKHGVVPLLGCVGGIFLCLLVGEFIGAKIFSKARPARVVQVTVVLLVIHLVIQFSSQFIGRSYQTDLASTAPDQWRDEVRTGVIIMAFVFVALGTAIRSSGYVIMGFPSLGISILATAIAGFLAWSYLLPALPGQLSREGSSQADIEARILGEQPSDFRAAPPGESLTQQYQRLQRWRAALDPKDSADTARFSAEVARYNQAAEKARNQPPPTPTPSPGVSPSQPTP